MHATTPRGAHLVGSVPLESAEEVFHSCADNLGAHLRRIPDGETGERKNWIIYQAMMLAEHPQFEQVESDREYTPLPIYQLREGVDPGNLEFASLGYGDVARESYATFKRLQAEGVVPESVRFQVSLPTPAAVIAAYVAAHDRAAVEPAYEAAMLGELAAICDAVPAEELAIQWDVCIEVGMWEEIGPPCEAWFDDPRGGSLDRVARLTRHVPAGVDMGFHLCYGDYGHEHFKQPADTTILVQMANGLAERTQRAIGWIHMPVPRDRDDAGYFEPLRELRLPPETKLYLGLVHMTDGSEGTRRRIETARRFVADFGVATECGFGRRPREQVAPLLGLHAEVAAPESSEAAG